MPVISARLETIQYSLYYIFIFKQRKGKAAFSTSRLEREKVHLGLKLQTAQTFMTLHFKCFYIEFSKTLVGVILMQNLGILCSL